MVMNSSAMLAESFANDANDSAQEFAIGSPQFIPLLPLRRDSEASKGKIPTLDEVLSGTNGSGPFTRATFAEYLAKAHNLENLEFVLEANTYLNVWREEMDNEDEKEQNLKMIWANIHNNYIVTESTKEVNLPCDIRTKLLEDSRHPMEDLIFNDDDEDVLRCPPQESVLKAYKIIKELLHDSYLDFVRVTKNRTKFSNDENYCLSAAISATRRKSEHVAPHVTSNISDRCISPLSPPFPATGNSNVSSCFSSPVSSSFHQHNSISSWLETPVPRSSNHLTRGSNSLTNDDLQNDELNLIDEESTGDSEERMLSEGTLFATNSEVNGNTRASSAASSKDSSRSINNSSPHGITNSTSNTMNGSRGSSLGSIVGSFKSNGEHINWRKAVKKFKIRRFSNSSDPDQQ